MVVIVGTGGGGVTFRATPFDTHTLPAHAAGFTTVMAWLVPAVTTSPAGIAAVTLVADTNVVVRGLPSTCTTAPPANPDPVTVNVNDALPAATLDGLIVVMFGVGLMTWNVTTGLCATIVVPTIQRNT